MLDDAFARTFAARFGGRPTWNRPELWPIVTDPGRADQRAWLSEELSCLGATAAANALQRLQKSAHFLATYNELAVGALFRRSSLVVEGDHEFPWGGRALTPDRALWAEEGTLVGLVEVSTRFRS